MERSSRIQRRFALLLLGILVFGAPMRSLARQDPAGQAEALIKQGREQGLRYLNDNDNHAKNDAKKSLEQAEKLLKDAIKRQPECAKCTEQLVADYFYQAYFGFSKDYDECIETAERGLARFPGNARLAFFKGYAHYNAKEYSEAAKALNQYLMAASGEPETEAKAREILKDSQQHFLTDWNRQASFFGSKESRIERYNAQTMKNEVVFQATPELEAQLGGLGFASLTEKAKTLEDPEVKAYLDGLVTRLLSKSPGPVGNVRITLIDAPEVNAVTPPGHIIVYRGLLGFAENESQLAGVLAHELGHNYAHHQARTVIKGYVMQGLATSLLQALKPQGRAENTVAQLAAQMGVGLYMKAYSRGEEKEADLYGAHIMFNAGYNPSDASSFFLKMYKQNPKQPIKFLSTHPPLQDRAEYLIDYLENFPLDKEMRQDSEEFQKIRARLGKAQTAAPGRGVIPPAPEGMP
jgi:predicted Zn-dependent protease